MTALRIRTLEWRVCPPRRLLEPRGGAASGRAMQKAEIYGGIFFGPGCLVASISSAGNRSKLIFLAWLVAVSSIARNSVADRQFWARTVARAARKFAKLFGTTAFNWPACDAAAAASAYALVLMRDRPNLKSTKFFR